MKREISSTNKGFSLAEMLIAVSVFSVFTLAFSTIMVSSFAQMSGSSNREKATLLAEEALEATRGIKDGNLENLVDGNYGLVFDEEEFYLSSSPDVTDIFTRSITISTTENEKKRVEAKVLWSEEKLVSLVTYFTYWEEILSLYCDKGESFLAVDSTGAFIEGNALLEVSVSNTAEHCDLLLERVSIAWDSPGLRFREVVYEDLTLWIGSAGSEEEVDLEEMVISSGESVILEYLFSGNMRFEPIFSITYTMSDGSSVTETNINPW